MQTKTKTNSVISTQQIPGGVRFTVLRAGPVDDHGRPTDASFDVLLKDVHEAIKERAMLHGLVQRIADKAAIGRDKDTGRSATPEDKFRAMKALADHYTSGADTWSPDRVTTGQGGRKGGLDAVAVAAVAEATGRTEVEIRELIARKAKEKGVTQDGYLAVLCESGAVKPILERKRREAVETLGDADDLLLEALGGVDEGEDAAM